MNHHERGVYAAYRRCGTVARTPRPAPAISYSAIRVLFAEHGLDLDLDGSTLRSGDLAFADLSAAAAWIESERVAA